ncbi:MAG: hypothetical protein ABWY06_02630 [Pseudomonas sp.]|uniref:hypothetical protein n=1 Tax=Pseudomonas sp. TaxID=306 RepID=UPI00339178E2
MKEIGVLAGLFVATCVIAGSSLWLLPAADSALFALVVIAPAAALALVLAVELSSGRLNGLGDIRRAVANRTSIPLCLAVYALGCMLVATSLVLAWRLLQRLLG